MKPKFFTSLLIYFKNSLEKERLSFFFACICIFLIPFYTAFIPPFMILWLISRIFEISIDYKKYRIVPQYSRSALTLAILFMIFFLSEAATLIYTENLSNGLNIVFSRLSLLVFPLLFILPGQYLTKNVKFLTKIFAVGTVLYIIYCFLYAVIRSVSFVDGQVILNTHPPEGYWMSYFFGSFFSVNQHPSYAAMFVNLSILVAMESILDSDNRKERYFWILSSMILFASVYFLSSRAGFITIFITIPLYLFIKLKSSIKKFSLIIILISLIIAGVFVVKTNERINIILGYVADGSIREKIASDGRILIWKSALEVIKKNPLTGVGIGDVRDELMEIYENVGDEDIIKSRYNAHNQFIEITVEGGLISLFIFLSLVVYMVYTAITRQNLILGQFLIIILVFFMFETVLYRLAGVSFFSLFSFLLLYYKPPVTIDKAI